MLVVTEFNRESVTLKLLNGGVIITTQPFCDTETRGSGAKPAARCVDTSVAGGPCCKMDEATAPCCDSDLAERVTSLGGDQRFKTAKHDPSSVFFRRRRREWVCWAWRFEWPIS